MTIWSAIIWVIPLHHLKQGKVIGLRILDDRFYTYCTNISCTIVITLYVSLIIHLFEITYIEIDPNHRNLVMECKVMLSLWWDVSTGYCNVKMQSSQNRKSCCGENTTGFWLTLVRITQQTSKPHNNLINLPSVTCLFHWLNCPILTQ